MRECACRKLKMYPTDTRYISKKLKMLSKCLKIEQSENTKSRERKTTHTHTRTYETHTHTHSHIARKTNAHIDLIKISG